MTRREDDCAKFRFQMGMMEIDFLIQNGIKVCPIEVKSGQYRKHASLDRFSEKFKSRLGRKYVVCTGDYLEENGIVYVPVYMAHCLVN